MYDDEFEDTFGFSDSDAGLSEDEMDDMLWEDECKQEKMFDREQRIKNQRNKSSFNNKNAKTEQKEGCYVATCVYGSYDCPEVWTLRRFRDYYLYKNIFGKLFIKLYYAISPKIVGVFGGKNYFKNFFKSVLDKMVFSLQKRGVKNTPYNDKKY